MVRGEGSYGWLCGCSHLRFPFYTACTAALMMDDDDGAGYCDAVRIYDSFTPHCRCVGDGGFTMVLCLTCTDRLRMVFHHHSLLVGGLVSSPATSPSWTAVWYLLHFPLVAPPVPPRYTFPDSSFDSCLARTSNVVHASLAVPLLKNFHLRHNQTAVVRSLVGPNLGFLVRQPS